MAFPGSLSAISGWYIHKAYKISAQVIWKHFHAFGYLEAFPYLRPGEAYHGTQVGFWSLCVKFCSLASQSASCLS